MPDIGQPLDADDFPTSQYEFEATQVTNLSNTTGDDNPGGLPTIDFTFTAPTSGRVLLICGLGGRGDAASGERVFATPWVWEGTDTGGTLIIDDSDYNNHGCGGMNRIATYVIVGKRSMLSGLTPGATHYAQHRVFVTGGSVCDVRCRTLGVIPLP